MWAFRITLNLTLEKSVSPVISGSLQGTLYRFPLDCLLAARSNFLSLILEPPWSSVVLDDANAPLSVTVLSDWLPVYSTYILLVFHATGCHWCSAMTFEFGDSRCIRYIYRLPKWL